MTDIPIFPALPPTSDPSPVVAVLMGLLAALAIGGANWMARSDGRWLAGLGEGDDGRDEKDKGDTR